MAAVAPSSTWIPEDDLLLKNAIEAGASLEALAKGAVQFSRKFTFNELQDRWHSLLYDPDISAQASARMGELQGSASNLSSEFNRSDKGSQSKTVHEKRKIGSIRKHYYAMRKRIRNDFFSSGDLAFLAEPNLHNCSGNDGDFHEHVPLDNGPPVGNCMPNHFSLQTNFDILHHAFPHTMMGIVTTNDCASNIGDAFHSEGPNSLADNHISRVARKDCLHEIPKDVSSLSVQDSLRNNGAESFQLCSSHEDVPHSLEDNLVDLGKCSAVEEMGLSQPPTDTKLFETDDSDTKPLCTFDSTNNNLQNACSELGGTQHVNSPNSDGSASFHTMGFSPVLPNMPLWKTMEDISAPAMPVNVSPRDKIQVAEDISALPDNDDSKNKSSSGHAIIHSGPMLEDRRNSDGFINPTAMLDVEFADLSESLLDFSNDDGILFMDVDGKDTMDKPCYDNSLLLSTPMDADEIDAPKVEPNKMFVSNTGPSTASFVYPADSEVITSQLHPVHGNQQNVSQSGVNMPSPSVLSSKPLELNIGSTYCTLNTEDPEIPCNDDIFLLIHPATSLAFSVTRPITMDAIEPSSSANETDTGQGLNFLKKGEDPAHFFIPSQMVGQYMLPAMGPKHALAGCTVKIELPDTSCMALAPRHANKAIGDSQCKRARTTQNAAAGGKLENDVTKVEFGVVDTPGSLGEMPLHAEAGSLEITLPEAVVFPLISDQEEPESDNDVPHFSDIEAMILEMDLGTYDQDSYFTRRVSKYQHEDSKRKIIRLEQCAQSSLQRAMASQGSLAILYGRRSKHFIRKTEVILGRSTEEIVVDIDLGKEGRANKISRRQAIIKMERDGSFFLKNLGKTSISVNGKAVATGQSLGLGSSCLIEIRGMNFVFEVNHKSVRQYLDNISKKSQVTNFEWSPAGEPTSTML